MNDEYLKIWLMGRKRLTDQLDEIHKKRYANAITS